MQRLKCTKSKRKAKEERQNGCTNGTVKNREIHTYKRNYVNRLQQRDHKKTDRALSRANFMSKLQPLQQQTQTTPNVLTFYGVIFQVHAQDTRKT